MATKKIGRPPKPKKERLGVGLHMSVRLAVEDAKRFAARLKAYNAKRKKENRLQRAEFAREVLAGRIKL
jgi:alkanesulfonate monooxygenase SsuD/methylene tetrahydromethanopterin reductase-like flavin-dependent oxidoreductase (luciferase family)